MTATESHPSVGWNLWREAALFGAQALARRAGVVSPGIRADLLVLDGEHVNLVGKSGDALLDALLFSGNDCLVKHVMVGGRWLVRDGHHPEEEGIEAHYRRIQKQLLA